MTAREKETFIRSTAKEHVPAVNERIFWSVHAVRKLRIEGLKKSDVEHSLRECTVIEDYHAGSRPFPDCLVLGFASFDPVHAVVAIDRDSDIIIIVTVYRPSARRWKDGWKKRKKA
jgi:hypothetical protein